MNLEGGIKGFRRGDPRRGHYLKNGAINGLCNLWKGVVRIERNDATVVRWRCNVRPEDVSSNEEPRHRLKLVTTPTVWSSKNKGR